MKTQTPSRRQFPDRSGITGFTRDDGSFQCTGSAMGRLESPYGMTWGIARLRVCRVNLDAGGYDDGGVYWGAPNNLWQARGEDDRDGLEFFTRAPDKQTAIAIFKRNLGTRPHTIS